MTKTSRHHFFSWLKKIAIFLAIFSLVVSYFYLPFSAMPLPKPVKEKLAQVQPEVKEAQAAWYSDYSYRRPVTLKASGNLYGTSTDSFPVLATTTLADLKHASQGGKIQTQEGYDLVWTDSDGETLLDFEVEKHSTTTGEIVHWIETAVSSTTDKTIYMYYGKSGASDLSDPTGVWDSGYKAVYHLKEEVAGDNLDVYQDSTINNYDADDYVSSTGQAGQIGYGKTFAAADDYIGTGLSAQVNDLEAVNGKYWSASAWFIGSEASVDEVVIGRGGGTGTSATFGLYIESAQNDSISTVIKGTYTYTGVSGDDNVWHYAAVTWNGSKDTGRIIVDGNEYSMATGTVALQANTVMIGATAAGTSGDYSGSIDEVRLSNIGRSPAWFRTEYLNQKNVLNFMDFGNEEVQPAAGITISGALYSGEGSGPLSSKPIKVSVATSTPGRFATTTNGSGIWSVSNVSGMQLGIGIAVWVDGQSEKAFTFTKASSTDNNITGVDLYQNRLILKHEATSATSTTIADLSFCDYDSGCGGSGDTDIRFTANGGVLTVFAGQELHIWTGKTFAPGGAVTLHGNAASSPDGDFHLDDNASTTLASSFTLAGSWTADTGSVLNAGSGTVSFNASTSRVINANGAQFYNLTIDGTATTTSTDFGVTNTLTVNSGKILEIGSGRTASSTASGTIALNGTIMGYGTLSVANSNLGTNGNLNVSYVRLDATSGNITMPVRTYGGVVVPYNSGSTARQVTMAGGSGSWYSNYSYRRAITLQGSKIATTTDSFPVLATTTLTDLKTTTWGGDVQNDNGYDIVWTDSDGTTLLDFEVEKYASTTGQIVHWIETSVTASADKTIYMYYGKSGASDVSTTTGVWDSNYKGIWHLKETSGNALDSTTYGTGGTVSGAVTRPSTGQIGNAYDFSTDGQIDAGNPADGHLNFGTGSSTVSLWLNIDQTTGTYQLPIHKGGSYAGEAGYEFETVTAGNTFAFCVADGSVVNCTTYISLAFDTWTYWVGVVDRTNTKLRIYKDGVEQGTSPTLTVSNINSALSLKFPTASYDLDGLVDEVRISNVVRTAGWITTEYNNQVNMGTFMQFGSETPYSAGGSDISANQVDTSTFASSTQYSFQRKTWYDGTRYWAAFDNGANAIEFWYSTNGTSWTQNTSATISVDTDADFSIETDSQNAFIAYWDGSYDVLARQASSTTNYPETNFTWGNATIVYDGSSATDKYDYPAIDRDSNNKVWIKGRHFYSGSPVFFDNYETGNHNNWTNTSVTGSGLAQVLSTNPYEGTYAGRYYRSTASDLSDYAFAYKDFTAPAGKIVWAKGYFRFDSIPSSTYSRTNNVLTLGTSNMDQTKARFSAYDSNTLQCNYLEKEGTTPYTSDWGTSLSTGVYYALKIKFDNSGSNPVITWYVNGNQICTYTDTTTGTAYTPTRVKAGSALDVGITYADPYYTGTADTRADNVGVYNSDPDAANYYDKARMSINANDISAWGTASTLDTSTDANKFGVIVSLAGGDMYTTYATSTTIAGNKYLSGTGWQATTTIATNIPTGLEHNMQMVSNATADEAYLVYIDSSQNVVFKKYIDSSGWQSGVTLDSNSGNDYPTISIDTANSNKLYAFWVRSNTVYYSSASSPYDSWSSPTSVISSGTANKWPSVAYQNGGNYIALIYDDQTGGGNSSVKFYGKTTQTGGGTYNLSGLEPRADSSGNITLDAASNNPSVNISGNLDFYGTGGGQEIIWSGTGIWKVSGSNNIVDFTNGTFTASSTNSFIFDGTNTTLTSAGNSFASTTISGTIKFLDQVSASGNVLISGTVNGQSYPLRLTGSSKTLQGGGTLGALLVDSGADYTLLNADITVGTTTLAGGTLTIDSGRYFISTSTLTISSGTLAGNGTTTIRHANLSLGGTLSSNIRFDSTDGDITMPARTYGGNVEFYSENNTFLRNVYMNTGTHYLSGHLWGNAAGTQNVTLNANTYNPTVNASGTIDFIGVGGGSEVINAGSANWDVDGNLDISAGLFTASAGNFYLAGNYLNNAGSFSANSGSFILNGPSQQTLTGTMTGANAFYNLQITNNSGSGNATNSPSVIFYSSASTTATFILTTASTTVRFATTSAYTFQNITWTGASGQPVKLRSADTRTGVTHQQWKVTVPGTRNDVSYIDFMDTDASYAGNTALNASNGTNINSGNNTNIVFVSISIVSAADQEFEVFENAKSNSQITISDPPGTINGSDDIRIAIATSTVNMRWDTSIITAELGGSAWGDDVLTNSVTYEQDGGVLVILVANTFEPGDTLTISGLKFKTFSGANAAAAALKARKDGPQDNEDDAVDTKKVTIRGIMRGDHPEGGQKDNKLKDLAENEMAVNNQEFFGFKLNPVAENSQVTNLAISLEIGGIINASDFTPPFIFRDYNGNNQIDAWETDTVGGSGVVSIPAPGSNGTITFSESFNATTSQNYILKSSLANLGGGDEISFKLKPPDITSTGLVTTRPLNSYGTSTAAYHVKSKGLAGGMAIGGLPPAVSEKLGGVSFGGEELGSEPGFNPPSAIGGQYSQWTDPTYAYASDGNLAYSATFGQRQDYGGFGFSLPANVTITGIELKAEASAVPAGGTIGFALSWNTGSSTTSPDKATGALPLTDTVYTLGGPSDTWGRTWTYSEFTDANFRVRAMANPSGGNTVRIDALQVKVYYQTGGGGGGGGGEI